MPIWSLLFVVYTCGAALCLILSESRGPLADALFAALWPLYFGIEAVKAIRAKF